MGIMLVKTEELNSAAESLRSCLNTMQEILSDTTNEVNRTESVFKSSSADALRNQYRSLATKFDDFYAAITKYALFLNQTASSYASANQQTEQKANELLNSGYNA